MVKHVIDALANFGLLLLWRKTHRIARSGIVKVRKVLLLTLTGQVMASLTALSVMLIAVVTAFTVFNYPMHQALFASFFTLGFGGLVVFGGLLLYVTRETALEEAIGLDEINSKIENLPHESLASIFSQLQRRSSSFSDPQRLENVEKSLEAVTEALREIRDSLDNSADARGLKVKSEKPIESAPTRPADRGGANLQFEKQTRSS